MINPDTIRNSTEEIRKMLKDRNMPDRIEIMEEWLVLDELRSNLKQQLDEMRRQQNELAQNAANAENIEELRENGRKIKEEVRRYEDEFNAVETKWLELIHQIPNLPLSQVPIGQEESDNKVVNVWGDIPTTPDNTLDHVQIAENLDLIDFEAGTKVSGSKFYFLKNDLVRLELALMLYGIDILTAKGYIPVQTPDLAKSRFYLGTGYAPNGDEAQTYEIVGEDLGLIATAEVTMAGMHSDEVIPVESLPLRYAAISHCFRREGGSYGKYSKGLYRVHQFTKLEMFVYCTPEQSEQIHQELLNIEEEITQSLGIPYRVLEMCTGDLGSIAARKFDLEAWMPGRNDFGEITSTSNCTDYQARNLNIKYKDKEGKNNFVHTLNGTAIVGSRIPIAILENFRQEDGRVKIPDVLIKYMGKEYIEMPK